MKPNDNHQPHDHDADDAMLTAYALGELEGTDAAAVEARIARDADARRTVDEIREFAGVLTNDLAAEPCPDTDAGRRAEVERVAAGNAAAAVPEATEASRPMGVPGLWIGIALAATLLIAVTFAMWLPQRDPAGGESWLANGGDESVVYEIELTGQARFASGGELAAMGYRVDDLDSGPVYTEPPVPVDDAVVANRLGYDVDDLDNLSPAAEERLAELGYFRLGTIYDLGDAGTKIRALGYVDDAPLEPTLEAQLRNLGYIEPSRSNPAPAERLRRLGYVSGVEAEEAEVAGSGPIVGARVQYEDAVDGDSFRRVYRVEAKGQQPATERLMVMRNETPSADPMRLRDSINTLEENLGQLQGNLAVSEERIAKLGRAAELDYAERSRLEQLGYFIGPVGERVEAQDFGVDFRGLAPETTPSTESYDAIEENPFVRANDDSRSTFSIDVDTASYANVRRMLRDGRRPPAGAVRIEEMVNYFTYDYPLPTGAAPFSAALEVAACPWAPEHRLVRVGLKGDHVAPEDRPPLNLVFLLDVSGSMSDSNKLPLVIESMKLLVGTLRPQDRVAIAVYAGASGLVLDSTSGAEQSTILGALDRLNAGGSTNGGEGIRLAYEVAARNFVDGGANRVILATDGDFNVGTTNESDLVSLVEEKAKGGVYLTILGYGTGNLKDSLLEAISAKGNGTYGYIDSLREAQKMFVDQVSGTLVTIAKDVKIQVEFNPQEVEAFRLVGYENRKLEHQDFNDDRKDAGEIGAGHTVTALYEVVPAGGALDAPMADALRYQKPGEPTPEARSGEMLTVNVRYKEPDTPAAAEARRNGVFDEAEPFTDVNVNGAFDAGEPFLDENQNGAWDAGDVYTDGNGNGRYDVGEPYEDRPIAPPIVSSKKLSFPLFDDGASFGQATDDFKFAAAVASFGMLLRNSQYKGQGNFDLVEELARDGLGDDRFGYRSEFIELVERARSVLGEKR